MTAPSGFWNPETGGRPPAYPYAWLRASEEIAFPCGERSPAAVRRAANRYAQRHGWTIKCRTYKPRSKPGMWCLVQRLT